MERRDGGNPPTRSCHSLADARSPLANQQNCKQGRAGETKQINGESDPGVRTHFYLLFG